MKKNILLVDDEPVFHFINSRVIELTGIDCEIQTASNGEEAILIINKYLTGIVSIPDVIFIDLDMPVMDGFEFIRVFQTLEFPNKQKITIVILTSSVDSKDRERAISVGIEHFISKPLTEADFNKLILEF